MSRWSSSELAAELVTREIVASISASTVWRVLDRDAIRPWFHRSWIFPRDPNFAVKAAVALDLYARVFDESPERHDPRRWFTASHHMGAVHVVRGEVGQCATSFVLVFDPHHPGPARGQRWVASAAALDAGLLIGTDHVLVRVEWSAVESAVHESASNRSVTTSTDAITAAIEIMAAAHHLTERESYQFTCARLTEVDHPQVVLALAHLALACLKQCAELRHASTDGLLAALGLQLRQRHAAVDRFLRLPDHDLGDRAASEMIAAPPAAGAFPMMRRSH